MGILSDIIGLIIGLAIMPRIIDAFATEDKNEIYKIFFRLIYPKWLSLKQNNNYIQSHSKKQFRQLIIPKSRLKIEVMFRN